jgi:pimeloyl-ACP methyl ester carboxylesterase
MAQRQDVRNLLPKIHVPTLVVVGREDAISTVEEMRGIADDIPDSELFIVEGAGHMSPMEQPQAVNEAIRRFLSR